MIIHEDSLISLLLILFTPLINQKSLYFCLIILSSYPTICREEQFELFCYPTFYKDINNSISSIYTILSSFIFYLLLLASYDFQ